MYTCKNKKCGKIFQNKNEKGIVEYNGMLYCETCGEPLVEVASSDRNDVSSLGLSGSQAVLNTTSDNRIIKDSNNTTTTNIYNTPQEEMLQTKFGMFRKSDLRLCVSCNNWVPLEYYENSVGLCRNCIERQIIEDGNGLYEVGYYNKAIATYLKAEKNGVLTAEIRCKVGLCYMELKDWEKAITYFALSKKDCVQSLYYMGYCYEHAAGGIKDKGKAEDYYRLAAEKGDCNAQRKVKFIEEEKAAKERKIQRKVEELRNKEIAAQKEKERLEKLAKEKEEQKRHEEEEKARAAKLEEERRSKEFAIKLAKVDSTIALYSFLKENGLILGKRGEKYGVFDTKGNEIIPFHYERFEELKGHSLIKGKRGGKWGLLDMKGNEITPFHYEYLDVLRFKDSDLILGKRGGKWGLLDMKENGIIPFHYDYLSDPYENSGFIRGEKGERCGLLDMKGNELTKFVYSKIIFLGKNGNCYRFEVEKEYDFICICYYLEWNISDKSFSEHIRIWHTIIESWKNEWLLYMFFGVTILGILLCWPLIVAIVANICRFLF